MCACLRQASDPKSTVEDGTDLGARGVLVLGRLDVDCCLVERPDQHVGEGGDRRGPKAAGVDRRLQLALDEAEGAAMPTSAPRLAELSTRWAVEQAPTVRWTSGSLHALSELAAGPT